MFDNPISISWHSEIHKVASAHLCLSMAYLKNVLRAGTYFKTKSRVALNALAEVQQHLILLACVKCPMSQSSCTRSQPSHLVVLT